MKTISCKITFLFFLFTGLSALAGEPVLDVQKEKTINKVYQVNPDAGIDIANKYGNIYVTTWNEDRVALDITIKVRGKSESKVLERLSKINVELNPLKHLVSAKTVIESVSGNNLSMEINYTIKIPKRGSVALSNQYGNIIVDKIEGNSAIECRYGNVTAGELNGESDTVKLKYCDKSALGVVKNVLIDAGYSKVTVSKAANIRFKSNYTNLNVKEAASLTYDSDYGDIIAGSVGNIKGTGNYLILKFGTVSGSLDIDTRYSTIEVNAIPARAKNFNISCAYTNVGMNYDADYAFDYECRFKYGNLSAPGVNNQVKNENGKDSFYKGFYKSSGDNKISVTSSYGNVRLTKI